MDRLYNHLLKQHFSENRQMALVAGPRQVGKTTLAKFISDKYISWDNQKDRYNIIRGPDDVAEHIGLNRLTQYPLITAFDELHKYSKWKTFIKGFFDVYNEKCRSIVTGSARLNVYKRGGDSLMGRYFLYRIHPLSLGELSHADIREKEILPAKKPETDSWEALQKFGGFPEPFIKRNIRFYNRWKRMRLEQLFHEDIRDITKIQEIAQIQMLADILQSQVGQLINFSKLAAAVNVARDTIKRWIEKLETLYYLFTIRPWYKNIKKSLIKQPKIYLWDWSMVKEEGPKHENLIASHLLKSVHFWNDYGLGEYGLFYLRDKLKREVDFLVTKNNTPWFLVEVKSSNKSISPNLKFFQHQTQAKHAFQIAYNMPFIDKDCFEENKPVIVPALTFLSQLV